jgi:hypothetical protein
MLCDATPTVWIRHFATQSKTTRPVHSSVHQGVHSSSSNAETCFNVQIFSFNSVLIRERSGNLKRGYAFNLQRGGYCFLFRSIFFFSNNTRVRILFFFVAQSTIFFSPTFNIKLFDKKSVGVASHSIDIFYMTFAG